jgi:hypothetical protein
MIISGNKLDEAELDKHLRFAVDLFLNGVRGR